MIKLDLLDEHKALNGSQEIFSFFPCSTVASKRATDVNYRTVCLAVAVMSLEESLIYAEDEPVPLPEGQIHLVDVKMHL
jgi:hypothetical protein